MFSGLHSRCPNGALYTNPECNPGIRTSQIFWRSEGTLHTPEWPRPALALCGVPSERSDFATIYPQGSTLGWYAQPRWGRGRLFRPTLGIQRSTRSWPTVHRPPSMVHGSWFMVHESMRSMNVLWLAFEVPQRGTVYQPRV